MKIIMFMGVPGTNNLELAHLLQSKYPSALIMDVKNVRRIYKDLPTNSPIIDFDFIKNIKKELNNKPTDVVMLVAPFILKDSRERFYEAFPECEYYGIWVERKREDLIKANSLCIPSYQTPINEIDYCLKYKVSPTKSEPFKDIIYVSREINIGISRNYPYVTDIETAILKI